MSWLRSLVFNGWFFAITTAICLWGVVLRIAAPERLLASARLWARLVLAGAGAICGVRYRVLGAEHLPRSGPVIVASQHQSAFDTLVWMHLMPRVAYVFKAELSRIPLFGPLMRLTGQIEVGRGAGVGALRAMLREADRAARTERQIVIFPEGTRVDHGVRATLQPGVALLARRTGLPVIPVATNSGRYWPRRAFRKRAGMVLIAARPALPAGLSEAALMAALRQAWDDGEAEMAAFQADASGA